MVACFLWGIFSKGFNKSPSNYLLVKIRSVSWDYAGKVVQKRSLWTDTRNFVNNIYTN